MVLYLLKLAQVQRPLMRQPSPSRVMVPVGCPLPLKACILPKGIKRRIGSTAACPADREATDEIRALQATAPSSLAKASIVWMNSRGAVSGTSERMRQPELRETGLYQSLCERGR